MVETQRQPVPRTDGDELEVALAFLDFARQSVLKKAHGLSARPPDRVGGRSEAS